MSTATNLATSATVSNSNIVAFPRHPRPTRPPIRRFKFAGLLADYSAGPHFTSLDWMDQQLAAHYGQHVYTSSLYHHVVVLVEEEQGGKWVRLPDIELSQFLAQASRPGTHTVLIPLNFQPAEVA